MAVTKACSQSGGAGEAVLGGVRIGGMIPSQMNKCVTVDTYMDPF